MKHRYDAFHVTGIYKSRKNQYKGNILNSSKMQLTDYMLDIDCSFQYHKYILSSNPLYTLDNSIYILWGACLHSMHDKSDNCWGCSEGD